MGGVLALGCLFGSARASAQVDLGRYARSLAAGQAGFARGMPRPFMRGSGGGVSLVVRGAAHGARAPELVSVGDFAVGELSAARFLELSQAHPDWVFDWAPPRHVLLDRIEGWVHAERVRSQTQTSGKGVVVGIIDTGVDLTHADLRTADGKTRVAWLLDVSQSAQGLEPDLEAAYGCKMKPGCAVYSASDLDALTANNVSGDEPNDPFGHGTHVASLAAGNGLSSATPRYIGVAPEATLVVVRVAEADGGILDADVLRAAKFVFDRADDLGMPAVVNLSLGSDFGAHDGNSSLELGLSAMVGSAFPGHAIVVAAGNSAGLTSGSALNSKYPGPFGIHTEVHVPRYAGTRVPLLTPPRTGETVNATVHVWVGFRNGDAVSVGVDDKSGTVVAPVASGQANQFENDALTVAVLNGLAHDGGSDTSHPGRNGAIVTISGRWAADRDFSIRLEGHGTAELWAQGQGDLNPEIGYGALFPRARKEGTINVPASAAALIAVGATLNRNAWVDVAGEAIDMPDLGALSNAPLDSIAYFSSAGPNALGALKPDIVAPGVFVAGAMARSADPRRSSNELFASLGRCPTKDECFVVDETHAITSGTSMSAPIVAGAIALLFQRDPTLTQDSVRAIFQAGARPLQGVIIDPRQIGPGALDLEGALAVASAGESPALRVPTARSWLTLSASSAQPDPTWPVTGYLDLRDDAGKLADGFDPERLHLKAQPATVREPLTRIAPGFFRFAVSAPPDAGGRTMQLAVRFDDQLIASAALPIARLPDEAASASGGCGVGGANTNSRAALGVGVLLALAALRLRKGRLRRRCPTTRVGCFSWSAFVTRRRRLRRARRGV